MIYVALILAVILINLMPVLAPPTWTILVLFLVKFDLNIYALVACGVTGATIGRLILTSYINWFSHLIFNEKELINLQYLGSKIGSTPKRNIAFTFIYSLTPLSSTELFIAAGIAKIKTRFVLIGFFFGRLISYFILAISTRNLVTNIDDLTRGILSFKSITTSILGFSIIFLFLFVDWIELYEKKHLKFNFKIWKWNKKSKDQTNQDQQDKIK